MRMIRWCWRLAERCPARVILYGQSERAGVRVSGVSARWPGRLSFRVQHGNASAVVNTQLVGEHWWSAAAGALTAALACGLDLDAAVSALEKVEPFAGRMQPLPLPSGATMLRGDNNPSMATLPAALEVLRTAQVTRRILVASDISDCGVRTRTRIRQLAEAASQSADIVLFAGEHSQAAAKRALLSGMEPGAVHSFITFEQVAGFLRSNTGEGDLILLRGCDRDKLARVYFAQFGEVGCKRFTCSRRELCDFCTELRAGEARSGGAPSRKAG